MENIGIKLVGSAGEGIALAGDTLAKILARYGYNVEALQCHGPAQRKGESISMVTFGDVVYCQEENPSIVACLGSPESYIGKGSLIYDDSRGKSFEGYAIPVTKISQQLKDNTVRNMVMLGAIAASLAIPFKYVKSVVSDDPILGKNPINVEAARRGYQSFKESGRNPIIQISEGNNKDLVYMSGNEAIAAGAIAAGCIYCVAYPITPATPISHILAKTLPQLGGDFVQVEDEIAAICRALGYSAAGGKAIVPTSGPGISLMQEALGYAIATEIPLVVVNVQRYGLSTGGPTWLYQGDLLQSLYGTHGGGSELRIVLVPRTREECFYTTILAFNMAELFQVPVCILSDADLGNNGRSTFKKPNVSEIEIIDRKRIGGNVVNGELERFPEYGVGPMPDIGTKGVVYSTTGLVHDSLGKVSLTPETAQIMMDRIKGKIDSNRFVRYCIEGNPRSSLAVITVGSVYGPVRKALEIAQQHGEEFSLLTFNSISHLPVDVLQEYVTKNDRVVVAELNQDGQLYKLIAGSLARGSKVIESLTKYDGTQFKPSEILDALYG